MRGLLAALLFLAAAAGGSPAVAAVGLDAATTQYLQGVWLTGRAPPTGACVDNSYVDYQLEFEFERTGGRLLSFEPFDLFGAAAILSAARDGDTLTLTIAGRPATTSHRLNLRILGPDRMEITSDPSTYAGRPPPKSPETLYRCGAPNPDFSRGVPTEALSILTPPEATGSAFVEAEPGQSDADVCWPKPGNPQRSDPNWIRFEVFGPAHFFVMGSMRGAGKAVARQLDLSPLRGVRVTGDHRLRIEGLERLEGSHGWNGGEQVKPFFYDIDWTASRIHIAQLDATFVNCIGALLPAGGQPPG